MKAEVTPSCEYAGRLVVELIAESPFEATLLEMFHQATPTFRFDPGVGKGNLAAELECV